ncbi:MAG: S1C family serine protease [Bacteroidota bacterium]
MRTTDLFDNYLFGQISEDEKIKFEIRLKNDSEFASAYEKHKTLVEKLRQHEERLNIKRIFTAIHQKEFGKDAQIFSINQGFVKKHGRTFAVAASVAIIAVISTITILSAGGFLLKKQSNDITNLKREVTELKYSRDAIIEGINDLSNNRLKKYVPANIEGTGFALNNKGYFITSLHMVQGSDSVFVTNSIFERMSAKLVASDDKYDLAIFKLENSEALSTIPYPFSFNQHLSEIGDKVYTIGYPRKDIVYGEGALSSLSGFNNDTTMFQISIPVNPGNSGGPLMDESGYVIGLIRGKLIDAEGTGFAVKSDLIKQVIDSLKNDSLRTNLILSAKKSTLKGLKRSEQIKKIQPFVFNIMVYKK